MSPEKKARGVVLAISLCVIFLLLVMGVTFINTIGLKYKATGEYEWALKALYAADSATRYATALMQYQVNNDRYDFLNPAFWQNQQGAIPAGGDGQLLYRIYMDPEVTPNPLVLNSVEVYFISLVCEGGFRRGNTTLAARTISAQMVISKSHREVHLVKWHEKYR